METKKTNKLPNLFAAIEGRHTSWNIVDAIGSCGSPGMSGARHRMSAKKKQVRIVATSGSIIIN